MPSTLTFTICANYVIKHIESFVLLRSSILLTKEALIFVINLNMKSAKVNQENKPCSFL
jgi:hypothetical protein